MGIKILIIVAVVCTLISASSAGIAKWYDSAAYRPSTCFGYQDLGTGIVAVHPAYFDKRGYKCGQVVNVTCTENGGEKPCLMKDPVQVRIVHRCHSSVCVGVDDICLSNEAFHKIADTPNSGTGVQTNVTLIL